MISALCKLLPLLGRNIKFRGNFYLHPSFDIYNTLGMSLLFKDIFGY